MAEPGSPTGRRQGRGDPAGEGGHLRPAVLAVVAVVLLGWAVKALAPVLTPLAAAILIALAVMPVRDYVRAWLPRRLRWLGPLAALLVLLVMLSIFFGGLYVAARQLVGEIPETAAGLGDMMPGSGAENPEEEPESIAEAAADGAEEARPEGGGAGSPGAAEDGADGGRLSLPSAEAILGRLGDQAMGAAGGVATAVLNAMTAIVTGLAIVIFLTLLILFESGEWRRKVQEVTSARAEWRLLESADAIAGKVRRYFLIQGSIGLMTAALYALWLWIFGVELLLVWASVTFLLTFIPVLGALIAGIMPVAYALLTKDFGTALAVGAGILAIEQVMGNFVEPRLQGRNIALSPLVILVALLFWSWVWGIAGALLAVPVTVALVVLGAHVPALRSWALMLTDRTSLDELDEVARPE